jgi:hypothetical protein
MQAAMEKHRRRAKREPKKKNAEAQAVIIITSRFAMLCSHDPCLQPLGTHPTAH